MGACKVLVVMVLVGGCSAPSELPAKSETTSSTVTRPSGMADDEWFIDQTRRAGIVTPADDLIMQGRTVCIYLDQPRTTRLQAKDGLRDKYGYSLADAGEIVAAAIGVYCPDELP